MEAEGVKRLEGRQRSYALTLLDRPCVSGGPATFAYNAAK